MVTVGDHGQTQLCVRIKQAREGRGFRKIDDLCVSRNCHIAANFLDLRAFHKEDLIRRSFPRFDRYELWPRIALPPRMAAQTQQVSTRQKHNIPIFMDSPIPGSARYPLRLLLVNLSLFHDKLYAFQKTDVFKRIP